MALLVAASIVVVGILSQQEPAPPLVSEFTVEMTIKEIAPRLNVTGKGLARELGLPLDTAKGEPVKALGITEEELDHAAEHILGHREKALKYYVFAALILLALVYLI